MLRCPGSDPYAPDDGLARWIISDLITVGSPLAHAELLLAKGRTDLTQRKKRRLFPADPPAYSSVRLRTPEGAAPADKTVVSMLRSFVTSLQPPVGDTTRMLSAAPFAAVAWTNIHFEHDMVGGQLRQVLGNGIRDVILPEVKPYLLNFLLKYPHSSYWRHGKRDRPQTAASCRLLRNLLLAPYPVLRIAGEAEAIARFLDWLYSDALARGSGSLLTLAGGEPHTPVAELRVLLLAPFGSDDAGQDDNDIPLCPVQWLWPGRSPLLDRDAAVRVSDTASADPALQVSLSTTSEMEQASGFSDDILTRG
jgi:hypothetical protein